MFGSKGIVFIVFNIAFRRARRIFAQVFMKKYILISCLGLFACQQTAQQAQETTTIPEEKLVRIMADVALADGAVSNLSGYRRDSLAHVYYQQVYELHGITFEEYEQNLQAVSTNTPKLEALVAQARALLTAKMDNPPKEDKEIKIRK
jgi:hypothetical protein